MTYTFDDCCYSDLHKDVYGFRPSGDQYRMWTNMSADEKQTEWDYLCSQLNQVIATEQDEQTACHVDFEQKIAEVMSVGAKTRKQAVQWIYDSLEDKYDYDYADWQLGLKYGTFKAELI